MILIVDKVAQTRFGIEPDEDLLTQDGPPPEPAFAVEVTFSGVDFKGRLDMLLTDPRDVGKFRPGETYDVALVKR